MTVNELRRALEGFYGDTPVLVWHPYNGTLIDATTVESLEGDPKRSESEQGSMVIAGDPA